MWTLNMAFNSMKGKNDFCSVVVLHKWSEEGIFLVRTWAILVIPPPAIFLPFVQHFILAFYCQAS